MGHSIFLTEANISTIKNVLWPKQNYYNKTMAHSEIMTNIFTPIRKKCSVILLKNIAI